MQKVKTKSNLLLLDTHVWIWLMNATSELSAQTISLIDQAAKHGSIYIAAISIWEMATLVAKKRITLQTSTQDWVDKALSLPGVNYLPLSPEIAVESAQLAGDFHGDPADRLLVASARLHNLTLLTRDEKILSYSKKSFLKTHKV